MKRGNIMVTQEQMAALRGIIKREWGWGIELVSNKLTNKPKVQGIYVERSGKWIFTVYPYELNPGNEIEIALSVSELALNNVKRFDKVEAWLEQQRSELQHLESNIHQSEEKGMPPHFRIGLLYADASRFLERLMSNLWTHDPDKQWLPPSSDLKVSVPTAPSAVPPRPAPLSPQDIALNHMLRMAQDACSQSGSTVITKKKEKRFEFVDENAFRQYVQGLLQEQKGLCAISGLPLQFPGAYSDPQLLASLDRIDSDGHYAPHNLQVVCRFVNRWKSDENDDEFRRLLCSRTCEIRFGAVRE